MIIKENYSLLRHNTFGIDVKADRFVEYANEEELMRIIPQLDKPYLHIGGGSNLLFTSDYHGTVLHSAIIGIEVVSDNSECVHARVGAGVVWDDFVDWAVAHQLGGVENLSIIPGEVGASAVQNIGAYGVEAKDVIESVEVVDLTDASQRVLSNAECRYGYRQSVFKGAWKGRYAVTRVTFRLSKHPVLHLDYGNIRSVLAGKDEPRIEDVRRAIIDIRNAKLPDPNVTGNAGSFFMNPVVSRSAFEKIQQMHPDVPHYDADGGVKIPAGWMIEKCGWKGKTLGKAGVHDKQALVLVNAGGATGADVLRLCDAICHDVFNQFGVEIHPEVNVI